MVKTFVTTLLTALASLDSVLSGDAAAQTLTTLHSFTVADGAHPFGGAILIGQTLYGCTRDGGDYNNGTLFAINTDGTAFKSLYSFSGGSDGRGPLIGTGSFSNILYGTAFSGGDSGNGTIFKLNTDGSGFQVLHEFTGGEDGSVPYGKVLVAGNTMYGTTYNGGISSNGVVFALNTSGSGFRILHSFAGPYESGSNLTINSDGALPNSGLVLNGDLLYGTASFGGNSGYGTVFVVNTNGTGFKDLHDFTDGIDGGLPFGDLVLSEATLYGMAQNGGVPDSAGTLFAINTDGTGFTNAYNFTETTDLGYPSPGLLCSGDRLYGNHHGSCDSKPGNYCDYGTVFSVNKDGTGFETLRTFTDGSDGGFANGGMVLFNSTLFGTTFVGGSGLAGTIFSISLPPTLTITSSGARVILSWPTNFAGYTLQSTTDLASSVWITNLPAPVVVSGLNTVTNPISGTQQFFRLGQ
jgi:uncharacterized repeat protein (TIGR03803 family)